MSAETVDSTALDTATTHGGGPVAPRDDLPLVGDRYRLVGMLGGGGMGNVYLARDTELDEDVAIKIIKAGAAAKPEQIDLLRREVKFARRVTHPNVLRTFDIGSHEGHKFITMELVVGRTLWATLAGVGLPIAEVARIARGVCNGLGAAHDAGVLHRDLKPSNVLLADDGRVLLSDFGIARVVGSAEGIHDASGTPGYIAPEVLADEGVDLRADIWSLGALLFEMLTGKRLFGGKREDLLRPLFDAPPDPSSLRAEIPSALDRVVTRCLARRPGARFGHPREVLAAIDAALPSPAQLVHGRAPPRSRLVAILPFESSDVHLGEGITALITDALAEGQLRAASRGAIESAGTAGRAPAEVGRDVGAEAIVKGSIRREGDELAIAFEVIGTGDGLVLFREEMRCARGELVQAAERVSRALANALLVARKKGNAAAHDAEAIDLYLRGRELLRWRWTHGPEEGTKCLREALARAPDDPLILSAYAHALAFCLSNDERVTDEARLMARRARALAPDRPEPHLASAMVALHLLENVDAARGIADALAIAPHHAQAHALRGLLSLETVGPDAGLAHLTTAITIDPTLTEARWTRGLAHALAGDLERCDAVFREATAAERVATDYWLARARTVFFRPTPERTAALVADLEAAPDTPMKAVFRSLFELCITGQGDRPKLEAVFSPLAPVSKRRKCHRACINAEFSCASADDERAMASIRLMNEYGTADVVWMDRCPTIERLRARDDFRAIRDAAAERAAAVRQCTNVAQ